MLFLITLNFSDSIFKNLKYFEKSIIEYRNIDKLDIAFFGSSHSYSSYDPRVFEKNLGVTAFNFGSGAQRIENTKLVAKYVLRKTPPKLAIIDIYKNSLLGFEDEEALGLQLETLDNLPISISKIEAYINNGGVEELPFLFSTTIRNHNNWYDLEKTNFTREHYVFFNTELHKGYRTYNQCVEDKSLSALQKKHQNNTRAEYNFKLSEDEKQKIDDIINLFKSKNISLLFVNAPTIINEYDFNKKRYSELIGEYLNKKRMTYINFDTIKDSLGLTKEHFKDPNHLNGKGAYIVSSYLSEYINQNYSFSGELPDSTLEKNRYFQFKTNFQTALFKKEIDSLNSAFLEGMTSFAIYKTDDDGMYDLVFETSKKQINDLRIKMNYVVKKDEEKYLYSNMLNRLDTNVRYFSVLTQCNVYEYEGKNYIVFPFQYTLPTFNNMQFQAGPEFKKIVFKIIDNKIK